MNNTDISAKTETSGGSDFISEFIKEDLASGRFSYVHTRFPPEPNGWLHIGHCKAFIIDFCMAEKFGGKCNLRFDDTNPEKENISYVEAIKRDIKWMGFDWEDREYYASDYYGYLYDMAVKIIKKGKAYVDDLSDAEIREYRGTDRNSVTAEEGLTAEGRTIIGRITPPGRNSPYRERSVEENLKLFAEMRAGVYLDGAKTLRAKIDMTHPNLIMRDPVMYRIRREHHYRTADSWCIYPMYDFQHPLSDAKEGITHSLCSLEYEIHRPLYDWFIREAEVFPSRQIEFARLNLTYTVMSKRWLLKLVQDGHVSGWDDPRMPTIAGLRRRGYTPQAIRSFVSQAGIAKTDSMADIAFLEYCLREDLNKRAPRVMAVLRPLKLIIENWDEGKIEELEAVNNPENESAGKRLVPFSRELWIERDDFEETPPPKYFRLFPGNSVRLRYAYIITCTGFDKDSDGKITAVRCTYDPQTKGGNAGSSAAFDNRRIKGTIHWLSAGSCAGYSAGSFAGCSAGSFAGCSAGSFAGCSAPHSLPIEVRLYDYLFNTERPMEVTPKEDGSPGDFTDNINPDSLEIITGALGERAIADAAPGEVFQFERLGYFVRDPDSSENGKPVFNRTVGLRDTWGKIAKKA